MTKKILLITGILVIVGAAVFLMFSARQDIGTGEERGGFSIRDYLPFGRSDDFSPGDELPGTQAPEEGSGEPFDPYLNQPVPKLRKISSEPVAGSVIFNLGTSSVVRFVEKGTGNVYEARSDSVRIERLTNTTIPKIVRAFWLPDGSGFLAQTLLPESEIIETSFVKLSSTNREATSENLTPYSITISKLPTGIKELAVRPDSARIFYYTTNGNSSWFVSNPDGTAATLVYTHPLSEWVPKWVSQNLIMMQNKSSFAAVGHIFAFNPADRTLRKREVSATGVLINPNHDGSIILLSTGGGSPRLFLAEGETVSDPIPGANTFSEKCAWSKDKKPTAYCAIPNALPTGNYPDAWYKGLVSMEDSVMEIDLRNEIVYNVSDLSEESGQKIDVVNMNISPDETHLIFENKIDGFLWMLRIEE